MKKLVDVEGAGLESFLGQQVLLLCANYFYAGTLTGVNDEFVLLEDPSVVYETGDWNSPSYKNAERLPAKEWRVRTEFIESYGSGK